MFRHVQPSQRPALETTPSLLWAFQAKALPDMYPFSMYCRLVSTPKRAPSHPCRDIVSAGYARDLLQSSDDLPQPSNTSLAVPIFSFSLGAPAPTPVQGPSALLSQLETLLAPALAPVAAPSQVRIRKWWTEAANSFLACPMLSASHNHTTVLIRGRYFDATSWCDSRGLAEILRYTMRVSIQHDLKFCVGLVSWS